MSDQSFAASIGGEFDRDGPSADDIVHALGLRGVLQKAERAGLQRRVAVALAERLKPEEGLNFGQALREVEHGVEIALAVITRDTHGTSATDGANAVLAEVAERTASANFDGAVRLLDDALAEIDHLEAKHREAEHRHQALFLEAAVKQHTLRRDAVGVVSRIERLVALDHTSDRLTSLRARYNQYLAEGDTKGLNFSLLIAVECARRMIEVSGQKGRGAALVDLGNALSTLGQRESGVKHLLEAVEVSREALKELTQAPLHWAIVQNNLGVMLCTLGLRGNGTERLVEAVEACREALKERTRERVPHQWAITQNNLGNALSKIGERERGTEHLLEAVKAYRNALEELTGGPIDRAMTQSNLGNALSVLGERENGTEHLIEAVDVYREALKERTRERVPLEWAMTQNNLGNALRVLGQRENSKERLVEAVEVCREALKERTRERVPLDWATTHNNLGNALSALGQRESDLGRLHEAIEAYHEALKELTPDNVPVEWSKARNNLINVQTILNERLDFNSSTSLSFEEPKQRQNSDLVAAAQKAAATRLALQQAAKERAALDQRSSASRGDDTASKPGVYFGLVSFGTVHDNPVPGGNTTPVGEPGSPQPRSSLPVPEAGHELTRPAATSEHQQIVSSLADFAQVSGDVAGVVVDAMLKNPAALADAARRLVKPKTKFLSRSDLTDAELNDPEVIRKNVEFARANVQTKIDTLGESEANKLRRARLIEKVDRDRRQKRFGL